MQLAIYNKHMVRLHGASTVIMHALYIHELHQAAEEEKIGLFLFIMQLLHVLPNTHAYVYYVCYITYQATLSLKTD